MYCSNCGTEVLKDDIFCFKCGLKLLFDDDTDIKIRDIRNENVNIEFQNTKHSSNTESTKTHRYLLDPWIDSKPFMKKQIIKSVIVGNDSRKSASSSIVRGAVGAAFLGPVGFLGGAISGKNKNKTTFLLIYNTGEKKTVTVKTNGFEFRTYVKYLDF